MIPRIQPGTFEFVRLSRLYLARPAASASPLHAYPTLESLLAALVGQDKADPDTRRRLICAAIAEHQTARGPLGAAIVLHAFRGMLVGLSKSLMGVDDRDEADGLVVAGLLEALGRVRPERDPERIGMYVRQETRRAVFAALRRDARTRQYHEPPDEDETLAREAHEAHEASETGETGETGETEADRDESRVADAGGDDAWCEEPPRDPLALDRASRQRVSDTIADLDSFTPIEDRILVERPTVDGIPDETLLMAHAVRGGLRRLAQLLFADASPLERRRTYQQIVARARLLAASK